MKNFISTPLVALATLFFLSNCGSVKYPEMVMMQNVQNQLAAMDTVAALKIRPNDLLSIEVNSQAKEAQEIFQKQQTVTAGSGENALAIQEGYRVDELGNIYMPLLGKVTAAGKTVTQLRQDVASKLSAYYNDVTVQVRFLNFRVTLMGEVTRPNAYIVPNEKLNVLEAVGMAGDFTPYARRNNVLIMRERNQIREFARLNTQDTSLFTSPYFYLQPNDVVYVEPLEAKKYATQGDFLNRYSGVFFPLVTLLTFAIGIAIAQ
jgi:polysaccharide export outer membrane protein